MMTRVKLLAIYCSPIGTFHPGNTIEVSEFEAGQLIDGGYAVLVPPPPVPVETTQLPQAETATAKPQRKRK